MGRTFAVVRPVLHRVLYGKQFVPNAPKQYETHQNISFRSNGVDRVRSLRKIPTRLRGTNFCASSSRYAPSLYGNQTVQNASKLYGTQQNMILGSNGVNRVRWLRKIPTRLRATNFCTSSARFAPSFVRQPNGPKCTQMVRNAPKHQLRV